MKEKKELAVEKSSVIIEWEEETSLNKPIRLKRDFDTLINVYGLLTSNGIELINMETGSININSIFASLTPEVIKEILNTIVWNLKPEDLSLLSIEEGVMILTSFFGELIKKLGKVLNTFKTTSAV